MATIDKNALKSAIDKTEKELNAPKKKTVKEESKTQVKETIKKGGKTITKTSTKKAFKNPEEFNNHPLANSINAFCDRLVEESGASHDVMFGESVVLTIDYYLENIPNHPLMFLGVSGGMLLIKGLYNKNMLPFTDKEKTTKEEKDKMSAEDIRRESNKRHKERNYMTGIQDTPRQKPNVRETTNYNKEKNK